jgi:hypothetical protein
MGKVIDSKVAAHDYRITATSEGLWIEVLDYHARPLFLSREQLAEFGLQAQAEEARRSKRVRRRKGQKPSTTSPA